MCVKDRKNRHDPYAVAVMRSKTVVGHLPRKISTACSLFLSTGTITCKVIGRKRYSHDLPQGGLEIPCTLTFVGPQVKIETVKKVLELQRIKEVNKLDNGSKMKKSTYDDQNEQQTKKIKVEDEEESNLDTNTEWLTIGQNQRIVVRIAEKQQLLMNEMLSDIHINACQLLLKNQFPNISGLCSTLQITSFSSGHWIDNYIQVIHCRGNHWITATTIGCNINEAAVYDSLYTDIDSATHQSIKRVLQCPVVIKVPPVGKQKGALDCGLFAIAFATYLAYRRDPSELSIIKYQCQLLIIKCQLSII